MSIKTIKLILLETILGVTTYLSLGDPGQNEELLRELVNNTTATKTDIEMFLDEINEPRSKKGKKTRSKKGKVNINSLFTDTCSTVPGIGGYRSGSQPLLTWAISKGNTCLFNALLEFSDIDVCVKNPQGVMPIHAVIIASEFPEDLAIKLLEKAGLGKINETCKDRSPLHYALACKKENVAKYLLNRKDLNPEVIDEEAITSAVKFSSLEIFKKLLDKLDKKINKNINWDKIFSLALNEKKSLDFLDFLISRKKLSVTTELVWPIVFASRDLSLLKFCLEKKLLHINDIFLEQSLLEASAITGLKDFVECLLDHNIDINKQSAKAGGPLHLAIIRLHGIKDLCSYENFFEIIKLLLNRNLDVNLTNFFGETALNLAVKLKDFQIVSLLLEKGAIVDIKDKDGIDSFYLAIRSKVVDENTKKIINALLGKLLDQKGGKIDQRYAKIAVKARNACALKLLLDCPSMNIDYQDDDDSKKSLLHLAAGDGWFPGVKILIEKRARLDLRDQDGKTPLDLANKLQEGLIKNTIMDLLGHKPTESTPEVRSSYIRIGGTPATRTAQRKGKPGQKTVETEPVETEPVETESGKQSEKDTEQSLFSETYSTVFSLFPGEKSKQLDNSKYNQGSDVINECINILKNSGIIEFSFGSNGENHNQLVFEGVLNASLEDFYKRTKKPDNIALNHGSNKICTDHFNETISYLIHFMFVALEEGTLEPLQKDALIAFLRGFNDADKLKKNELKDLYPNTWNELNTWKEL